jgi:hypothetical protein
VLKLIKFNWIGWNLQSYVFWVSLVDHKPGPVTIVESKGERRRSCHCGVPLAFAIRKIFQSCAGMVGLQSIAEEFDIKS